MIPKWFENFWKLPASNMLMSATTWFLDVFLFKILSMCPHCSSIQKLKIISWFPLLRDSTVLKAFLTIQLLCWIFWTKKSYYIISILKVNAKGVVCYYDGSTVQLKSFQTSQNMRPTLVDLANGNTLIKAYLTTSNAVVCEFSRSITVPNGSENLMLDLTDPVYVLYSHGDYSSGAIQYHGSSDAEAFITNEKVDLSPTPPPKPVVCFFLLYFAFIVTKV